MIKPNINSNWNNFLFFGSTTDTVFEIRQTEIFR